MTDLLRDIGAHDEAIDTLKAEVAAMRKDLGEIKVLLSETKGGLRMLIGVATAGGAIGAAIMKFFTTVKGGL